MPLTLGVILSGESSTAVGSPSTISVDDDFSPGEASITLRTANDESTGWLEMVDRVLVDQMSGNNCVNNLTNFNFKKLISICLSGPWI